MSSVGILNSPDYATIQPVVATSSQNTLTSGQYQGTGTMMDASHLNPLKGPKFTYSKTGFSLEASGHFRTQEMNRFRQENRDLLHVIDSSDKAKEFLSKTDIATRDDLIRVIAQTANELLEGNAGRVLTEDKLKQTPLVASMIVLNTGGLMDLINKDTDAAKVLAETSSAPETDSYKTIAKKAADLFVKGSPMNDEDFFKKHPKVAVYILNNRDRVASLNKPDDGNSSSTDPLKFLNQKNFKDRVTDPAYDAMFDAYLATFTSEAVDSGAYSSDFFTEHVDIAEYVGAGEFISDIPKPSEFLHDHPEYNLDNTAINDRFNMTSVINDIMSFQAATLTGPESALTSSVLRSNLGLARLIVQHEDFRSALASRESLDVLEILVGTEKAKAPSEQTQNALKDRFQATFEGPRAAVSLLA